MENELAVSDFLETFSEMFYGRNTSASFIFTEISNLKKNFFAESKQVLGKEITLAIEGFGSKEDQQELILFLKDFFSICISETGSIISEKLAVSTFYKQKNSRAINFSWPGAQHFILASYIDKKSKKHKDFFLNKDIEPYLLNLLQVTITQNFDFSQNNERLFLLVQKIYAVAKILFQFLAAFEDTLLKQWQTSPRINESQYVIDIQLLKKAPSLLQSIIANEKALKKQQLEWDKLSLVSSEVDVKEYLSSENIHLPLDTRYFTGLKEQLEETFAIHEKWLDGILIYADNFRGLNLLKAHFTGEIQLIYTDPPYNTGSQFKYKDTFSESAWLTLMANRLEIASELLAEKGSFYLHLDQNANYLGRFLMDEVFGKNCFQTEIFFKRTGGHHLAKGLDIMADSIYWYGKSQNPDYRQQYSVLTQEEIIKKFPYTEEISGRRFMHRSIEETNNAANKGELRYINKKPYKTEMGWRWSQKTIDEKLAQNPEIIFFTKNGRPRYKIYADEYAGRKIGNLWDDIKIISSNAAEFLSFTTQKPEDLLKRIVQQSSNEKDWVLDYFAGTGTTLAVAHKLKRRWIGIEVGEHFESIILPRMKKVIAGTQEGISKEVGWKGGGCFMYQYLNSFEEML